MSSEPFTYSVTVDGATETFSLSPDGTHMLNLPVGATFAVEQTTGGFVTKVGSAVGDNEVAAANAVRGKTYEETVVDGGKAIKYFNYQPICKIDHGEKEEPFESLNAAADYARTNMGSAATIQMLVNYVLPNDDDMVVGAGDDFVLTTASKDNGNEFIYGGDGTFATISRGDASGVMFEVREGGKLQLTNVALQGTTDAQAASVLLKPSSWLGLSGLVKVDGNADDVGSLVLESGATGAEIEVVDDLVDGSHILVWAEDESRDGANLYADESFGVTTAPSSASVQGLERLVSQRERDTLVTASAGDGNQVIWMAHPVVELKFLVEGAHADLTKEFDFVITLPEGVDEVLCSIDGGQPIALTQNSTFALKHDQTARFEGLRSGQSYVLTQTTEPIGQAPGVTPKPIYGTASYNPRLTQTLHTESTESVPSVNASLNSSDARILTLSNARSLPSEPAKVTITNVHSIDGTLPTGIADNTGAWTVGTVLSACLVLGVLVWMRRSRRIASMRDDD